MHYSTYIDHRLPWTVWPRGRSPAARRGAPARTAGRRAPPPRASSALGSPPRARGAATPQPRPRPTARGSPSRWPPTSSRCLFQVTKFHYPRMFKNNEINNNPATILEYLNISAE